MMYSLLVPNNDKQETHNSELEARNSVNFAPAGKFQGGIACFLHIPGFRHIRHYYRKLVLRYCFRKNNWLN